MLLHHPSLVKKPRSRKFHPTQAQALPPDPIPFKADYNPKYLLIHYDLETTDLLSQSVRIVNVACELDTVLLEQWQKVNRGAPRCVYCDQKTDEATDIRPTVCKNCEGKEDDEKEPRLHWFETLVNPECKIPDNVQAIHGITDTMVQKAPKIKEVLIEMFKWIENLKKWYGLPRDFPVLLNAYGGNTFDQVVLQWELLRSELLVPANIYFGDLCFTIINAFAYSYTRETGEMKMERLVQRICRRPGFKQQHTSACDVEAMIDIMHAFIDRQDLYENLFADRQRPLVEKQLRQAIGSSRIKQKQSNASNSNSNYQPKYKKQKQRK
jgi:hypothetical protein